MTQIQLIVVGGVALGERYTVPQNGAIIGRSSSCNFSINDGALSRQHCSFYIRDGIPYVKDLDSANGSLVNGEVLLGERLIEHGDIVTLGEATVLRVELRSIQAAESASVASIKLNWSDTDAPPMPQTSSPELQSQVQLLPSENDFDVPIDLGLGDNIKEDETVSTTQGSSKKMLRLLIVALSLLILVMGGFILFEKMIAKVAKVPPTEKIEVLEDNSKAPFDLYYEHLSITPQAVFSYRVTFSSSTSQLMLQYDNLGDMPRNFEEKKVLSEKEIERLRNVFIRNSFEEIKDQNASHNASASSSLDRKHIHFALGRKIWERKSENYATTKYNTLCRDLETCVSDLLNLKDAQYSVAELVDLAKGHLEEAEAYWALSDNSDDNLRKSYTMYRDADAYLRTINPKPDFAKDIQRGINRAKKLMNERYDNYQLEVDQARHSRDVTREIRALSLIIGLLPELEDRYDESSTIHYIDLYRQAEERLEILGEKRYL